MGKFWQNLSVSKKLYGVVGIMALLIAAELFTLYFAMTTLSAVRGFVGSEGLWSKAQKTAVNSLLRYAMTRDEANYRLYLDELEVPLGGLRARLALESPTVDIEGVKSGLLQAKNHPLDIMPMVRFAERFRSKDLFKHAIETWRHGDQLIAELVGLGQQLHFEIQRGAAGDRRRVDQLTEKIFELDRRFTRAENDFSYGLGAASRWLEGVLMALLLVAVILVEGTGVLLTVSLARSLKKTLSEFNAAAEKVGEGDFSQRLPVQSTDELGQLAMSLNRMASNLRRQTSERQNAEHASEAKNLFLANMSHEIRTPLNAILGFAEILSDATLSVEDRKSYATIIKRTGASLTSIINDILDLSKVEAESLEIEVKPFSVRHLLEDLQSVSRLLCQEKGLQFSFVKRGNVAEYIESDPVRLRQILVNIIGNSIKFTEHGSITVFYEVVGGHLLFTVQDTGSGVSPEQVGRLFKPFSQGDSSVRKKFGGTGLGLLISQRLAQLLGGDVSLKNSVAGQGSCFAVQIAYVPIAASSIERARPMPDEESRMRASLAGKKILVVEDSLDNQLLADLFLTKSGAHVEFANNGLEGVEKAWDSRFDIVLMDIQMPVMDGYAATRELRERGCRTPIVALTGFAMKEDRERCLKAGCDDYLSKPFDRSSLVRCVAAHIN
ncbi:MAG: response regulator [Bdellovibrionaceae bacterium]|nr:response regulator [Pseudobdellovibrionaceae bacterium]